MCFGFFSALPSSFSFSPPHTYYVSTDVEENIWFGFDLKGGVTLWMTSWYKFTVGGEE